MADSKKWINLINTMKISFLMETSRAMTTTELVQFQDRFIKIEDQSSSIYDGLASDKERNTFLEDFYNVAEYLKDNPNYTDEEIAKFTLKDRKGVLPKILK